MSPLASLALAFLLTEPGVGSRIRIEDSRLAALLADGVQRSPTLQSLVERVQESSVIVMVQTVRWLPRELAGAVTWIGASAPNRYVRVTIKLQSSADALLASLGHELQHVVEVIGAPWVSDSQSLLALYRQIGTPTNMEKSSWDSAAARWTGDQILRELKGLATLAAADDER